MERYITEIKVNHSRNVKDLTIPLSKEERQHLIITGKNGSGKTSLLLELNKHLNRLDTYNNASDNSVIFAKSQLFIDELQALQAQLNSPGNLQSEIDLKNRIRTYSGWLEHYGGIDIFFSIESDFFINQRQQGKFLLAFFDSKRKTSLNVPTGIQKVELKEKYSLTERANSDFLQYLVNLKADRSFARDDNETQTVSQIDNWFNQFENRLRLIFGDEGLSLRFDRKEYNFAIVPSTGESLNFNTLPDGYSSIISIVSELLLRMEAHDQKSYDLEGIVLIDEIETHLHVDLQKKILPFLTDFFPKIQFIVSTHSPFVLSSISNAVICDLETKIVTNDLTSYSYDALIESYFKIDKYSEELKLKVAEFEQLTEKSDLNMEELDRLHELRDYFAHSPKFLSDELVVKLQEIELNSITKKR